MNKYLQDYLISPETRYPLYLVDETEIGLNSGQLKGNDPLDVFNIVNGIPILLPHNHVADYNHNIVDILYREQTKEISNEILSKTGRNYELYKDEFDRHILNEFGKEGILKAYEEYSKFPRSQKLGWFATLDNDQKSDTCSQIPSSTITSGLAYATSENGKQRLELTEEMITKWACHLNDYGNLVSENKSGIIVELGTGAGFGTCGVIKSGLGDSKLISIDIDYAAAANAKGISKYLGIEDKVNPIVANFWYLPFKTSSIDTLCSHYGLDEAREIPSILTEISRILKVGGKFINVSRMDPTLRIKQTFGHLNFSESEYLKLASFAGFYSGMDDLINEAEKNNLKLEFHKVYSPKCSHERILSIFKKV